MNCIASRKSRKNYNNKNKNTILSQVTFSFYFSKKLTTNVDLKGQTTFVLLHVMSLCGLNDTERFSIYRLTSY